MSYPELYSDERVVLQAQNVKVKSVLFEIVLTTRRLVLIDSKKNSIPPQEINLATLKDVESGENAIRDPTITISIITISGNTRQMVLTFSKTSGGERRRECDEWVRALRQNITSTIYHPVPQASAAREPEPVQTPQPPAAPQPVPVPPRSDASNIPPPKKRIEIARPMKKIVEAAPAIPVPVETSTLPTGSFCNRCGNRVPPESAFCNRCGTPVAQATESANIPMIEFDAPPAPAPAVPQVQVSPSPIYPTISEKKERPIENVIHSIEPLIEGSVPRTAPAPLVPAKMVHHPPPAETPPQPEEQPVPAAEPATPEGGAATPSPVSPTGDVQWPVLSPSGISTSPATETPAAGSVPVSPPLSHSIPPATPSPRKIPFKLIGVVAIVILAVIGGVFIFMQGQGQTPAVTPTPELTVPPTTILPTTEPTIAITMMMPTTTQQQVTAPPAQVPQNGVFVKVTYEGKYTGTVGTPGRLREITESSGPFFQISTSDGPVVVSVRKTEGNSAKMEIDVYKDGTLVKHDSTVAPKGLVEFEAVFTPATTATTAVPETTAEPTPA